MAQPQQVKDLIQTNFQVSLTSKKNYLTEQDSNTAIDLLTKLVALRGESINNYKNLALWVCEFEKDGYTLKDIEKIVDLGKKLPKYNPLSYGDLITAFEENGNTVTGYKEYKEEIIKLNDKISELERKIFELGWYREKYLEMISPNNKPTGEEF